MFLSNLFTNPAYFVNVVVIVIISITVHEFFHALAALWQGDDTAARAGRLSLNPLVHMGQTSIIMLILLGIAWGETPVNRSRLKYSFSPAIVSFAGPFANLLLLMLGVWIGLIFQKWHIGGFMADAVPPFCYLVALFNGFLFLLNMLPLPPLDGFGVLETFAPPLRRYAVSLSQYGFLILVVLFLFFNLGRVLMLIAQLMVGEVASLSGGILKAL